MFFVLLALWILFNARLTLEIVLTGIVLSALLTAFGRKYCRWSASSDLAALGMALQGLHYAAKLFVEIIKANLQVLALIASPKTKSLRPVLFFFDTKLKTNVGRTTLANSITLTPGTYTIGIYDTTFAVHALTTDFAEGTIDSDFNRLILALEQKAEQEASK